jgi:methylenetetrahydrofolate dehydrogenase (NADP+)/methenyltetrahydrofolate cyclohydrolase
LIRLDETASLHELLRTVRDLNESPTHDGILVQSPLPAAMGAHAEVTVFETIAAEKDVDGFSPINVGRLVQNRATLKSCTPAGVIEILTRSQIEIAGQRAVVIGRSDIVGKPMSLMLLHKNATVTICHSRTKELAAIAREADILVAALGRPAFVDATFPPDSPRRGVFAKNGTLIVGDVHPAVAEVAGAITPVPGGVGPLTIAMLMHNVLVAAESRLA